MSKIILGKGKCQFLSKCDCSLKNVFTLKILPEVLFNNVSEANNNPPKQKTLCLW